MNAGSPAEKSRGQHANIIDHHQFVAPYQGRQLAKCVVFPRAGHAVEKQHPRCVTLCERVLCDSLRRQLIIEVAYIHPGGYLAGAFAARSAISAAILCISL